MNNSLEKLNTSEMDSKMDEMRLQLDEKIKNVHSGLESATIFGKIGEGDFALEIQMNGKHRASKTNLPSQLLGSLFPSIDIPENTLKQAATLLCNMITMTINNVVSKVEQYSKERYDDFMKEMVNKMDEMKSQLSESIKVVHAELEAAVVSAKLGEGDFVLEIEMNGKYHAKNTILPFQLLDSLFPGITISEDTLKQAATLLGNIITMTINDGVSKVDQYSKERYDGFMKEVFNKELEASSE